MVVTSLVMTFFKSNQNLKDVFYLLIFLLHRVSLLWSYAPADTASY